MRAVFGERFPILTMPGNHDYYVGGKGFYDVIDDLGVQQASYLCLRGSRFQILAIDTGLLDNFVLTGLENRLFDSDDPDVKAAFRKTIAFLPEDQFQWARYQLEVGKTLGLKTIVMSHHQLFSRTEDVKHPNGKLSESSTVPDRARLTYYTEEFSTSASELPGNLSNDAFYPVNTRLLKQFPPSVLEGVAAWYWGHEHSSVIYEPYAGLKRGRCMGNSAIPFPIDFDPYAPNMKLVGEPWGGLPQVLSGSKIGKGAAFWNLGFLTLEFRDAWGASAEAKYFQMQDSYNPPNPPVWSTAAEYFTEQID